MQISMLDSGICGGWRLASSSDPHALSIVDGTGRFAAFGPHYSRRTPGSKTFTGVGREVVLVTDDAVWAVVLARPPQGDGRPIWRNNLFRNLGRALSSDLIRSAVESTRRIWLARYGELPDAPLRTEVDTTAIRSTNPGYCYICAGWTRRGGRRSLVYLFAPEQR